MRGEVALALSMILLGALLSGTALVLALNPPVAHYASLAAAGVGVEQGSMVIGEGLGENCFVLDGGLVRGFEDGLGGHERCWPLAVGVE